MRRTANVLGAVPDSVLDYDQLQQIVSRNRVFLRDFIMVLCCILIFVIIAVFILFVLFVATNKEQHDKFTEQEQQRLLANIDYRNA
ncbi:hypothetical protein [Orgyia leucostigma nucleopolyhedrovirus]|uniref:Ac108 n=1 Tax=Orgyia leucostigma nucleopolyhedrovirus TaxID=490711 RepID=B0FDW2_9ABAC|nr:hypothetical protein [Orgyia leucostigma nucleopolyhedrovirus]ABY65820.1 hypothetical protein [Orgyia leucostigma nucleopolyhedrovirus]